MNFINLPLEIISEISQFVAGKNVKAALPLSQVASRTRNGVYLALTQIAADAKNKQTKLTSQHKQALDNQLNLLTTIQPLPEHQGTVELIRARTAELMVDPKALVRNDNQDFKNAFVKVCELKKKNTELHGKTASIACNLFFLSAYDSASKPQPQLSPEEAHKAARAFFDYYEQKSKHN